MFKSRSHYIEYFRRMINLERQEDIQRHEDEIKRLNGRQRERRGRALVHMRGKRQGRILGGQQLVKYMKAAGEHLPDMDMRVGDVVLLSQGQPLKKGNPLGTVVDINRYSVTVLFESKIQKWTWKDQLRIDLYVNDVTYRRMQEAQDAILYGKEHSPGLVKWVIGEKDRHIKLNASKMESGVKYSVDLNASQNEAVHQSLEAKYFHIVHGPPGTGKTRTGIEIIVQAAKQGEKVLATADSNGAVDNLLRGLINKEDVRVVRLGRSFKVEENLQKYTLDAQVMAHESHKDVLKYRQLAFDYLKEQEGLKRPSPRWTRGLRTNEIHKLASSNKGSRGVSASDMKQISKWMKIKAEADKQFAKAEDLESQIIEQIFKSANVVLCTNSGAGQTLMEGRNYDLLVVDEATQATEAAVMIPIVKAEKVILLGDHKQLPPTVLSEEAVRKGFSVSLLERLIERYGQGCVSLLDTQYRMHEDIASFSNQMFYENKIKSDEGNAKWVLGNDEVVKLLGKSTNVFMHIKGIEKRMGDGPSIYNLEEAQLAVKLVDLLLKKGVAPNSIGVITPYKAQVRCFQDLFEKDSIKVDTVDGFQGQEKDVIIMSMVRSNKDGQLGFLNDTRRLNVSLTRARKLRVVIGNEETLRTHPVYAAFLNSVHIVNANSFQ